MIKYNEGSVLRLIKRISVNGELHQIDYNTLANKPSDEFFLPSVTENDAGKTLTVNSDGSWSVSDFSIIELCESVATLTSQLNRLQARVDALVSGSSDTQAAVMNDKITLNGSGASITGEKLSVTGSDFTVNGEKLSIA